MEPCSWNSDNNDLPELAQPEEDENSGSPGVGWVWDGNFLGIYG